MDKEKQLVKLLKDSGVKKLPDSKSHVMRLQIRGESNKKYIISKRITALKRWECGCLGWIFKRKCKHLDAMAPILSQIKALTTTKAPKLLEYQRPRNAKK